MSIVTKNYIYTQENQINYKCIQTRLFKKADFENIYNINQKKIPKTHKYKPYHLVNAYYPFTEDVDVSERVNHILEKPYETRTLQDDPIYKYAYSHDDAQKQYLNTLPLNFLILGKPQGGQSELGKAIANYWKSVYLDPLIILEEYVNISKETDKYLRDGHAIDNKMLMHLFKLKINSQYCKHRGFIICDLPLIPNDLILDEENFAENPTNYGDLIDNLFDLFELVPLIIYLTWEQNDLIMARVPIKNVARSPDEFQPQITTQLARYRLNVSNYIEHHILTHDLRYFLKIDGRLTVDQMLDVVRMRLKLVPIQHVAVPEFFDDYPINLDYSVLLDSLSRNRCVQKNFLWSISDWSDFCPVSLDRGDLEWGLHFMDYIYFFADEFCLERFCMNPRLYLDDPRSKKQRKMLYFGPEDDDLIQLLGQYYYMKIFKHPDLYGMHFQMKIEKIKRDAMEKLEISNLHEAEYANRVRLDKIREWKDNCLEILLKLDEDPECLGVESGLIDELVALNLPILDDVQDYRVFLDDPDHLIPYLPGDLVQEILPKPVRSDDDFVLNAIENIDLTDNEIIDIYDNLINNQQYWILINLDCSDPVLDYISKTHQLDEIIFIGVSPRKIPAKFLIEYRVDNINFDDLIDKIEDNYRVKAELIKDNIEIKMEDDFDDVPFVKQYGDTYDYCPITFYENWVLWKARRVPVPDARFDYLCDYFKPLSKVPAFLNVVDIAGLVKGASEGQGLGNAFLSHISACDAIFHLCRAFEDDDVTHVEGDVNPVRDLDIIAEELRLKDEETLMKNLEKLERVVLRGSDKKLKPEYDALMKIKGVLIDEKKHIRFGDWDAKDIEILNKYLFLTSKPALYLVNLSEKDFIKKKNKWLIKIKEWVDKNDPGSIIIPFSGAFEQKLFEDYDDLDLRKKFLEENQITSALDKIIVQGYKALQLEYFFTAGPDEVKAWTVQKGTKAPQAAGRIHTDFEKGFIMAEVMKFDDFKEEGSESGCKAAGKYRQQGRNYTVEDGDIVFFKFNAGAGLKDAKKK